MNITILGNEGSWYVNDLTRAATSRGHQCQRLDFPLIRADVSGHGTSLRTVERPLDYLDAVIVRTMPPGSLEQVVYRMDALARWQANGVHICNSPKAIECAVDKFLTTSRLNHAGLPVPRTIVCEDAEQAMDAFGVLGADVVVKPIFGSEGRGIVRVSDPDLAFRVFRAIERTGGVLYLQEYIAHAGFDLRLLVLAGTVIGAISRWNAADFRTNVARKGQSQLHTATDQEMEYAVRAAEVVGAEIAGIDLLYDRDGNCFVIEVNGVPGWQAFRNVTGVDVASLLVEHLEHRRTEA